MPIELRPVSRRRFLSGTLVGGLALLASRGRSWADSPPPVDPNRLALLSDIHVNAEPGTIIRGVNMADHLRQAVDQVLKGAAPGGLPSRAIVNGDCAHLDGKPGDYATIGRLVEPLAKAGVPVVMAPGNHDDRDQFLAAFPDAKDKPNTVVEAVDHKHVVSFDAPRARVVVLDSLDVVNQTAGKLGEGQVDWLAKMLDASPDKTTLLFVHHHPEQHIKHKDFPGVTDTPALMDVILKRKQVKALFYGHTHEWERFEFEGLHLVNLPTVSYVFGEGQPSAWVDCQLGQSGATLTLRCVKPNGATDGEKVELKWRS
jgi:Icc protein